jgi:hypothetical protein
MDMNQAIKATRNGAIAASISAALTLAVVLIAISADIDGELAIFNDPANFFDIAILIGCAIGMYRKSRIASVLVFTYYIISKIIITMETQSYAGLGIALIFLYFYGMAIQGSFTYHMLRKKEEPDYNASTVWTYIIGVPSTVIVCAVLVMATLSITGVTTATRVMAGDEIPADDIATLESSGIISNGDSVKYFYPQGLTSILESGNILTTNNVILYYTNDGGELEIYEIPLNDVTDVMLESQGDTINDSVYKVVTDQSDVWIKLFLSNQQKGDQKFVQAIRDRISVTRAAK